MIDRMFKEEVIHSQDDCKLTEASYDTIRETIRENHAVGFLAGYYDERLTIASVSGFFLYELGYTYQEFLNTTQGSLRNLFLGENTSFLKPGRFENIKGSGEGQLLMKGNVPAFVRLYKADMMDANERPMWVLSSRIDWMQQNLQLVNNTIGSGFWYIDCDANGEMESISYSHEFRRMLGYHDTLDFPNVLTSWENAMHPEDRENTLEQLKEALADRTNTKKYSVEYRMRMKDGEYQWFRNVGDITRRLDGTAHRMAGIFVNIEDELEQKRLNQRSEAFHRAYTESNICEYYLDLKKNSFESLKVSDSFLKIFEKSQNWEELIQLYLQQFVCEDDKETIALFYNREFIRERFAEGKNELSLECKIKIEGKIHWVRNILILDEMSPDYRYAMVFVRDITKAKAEAENIQELTKKNKSMDMLIQGMVKLVDRYVLCDLEKDSYKFYSRWEGDTTYPSEGTYRGLIDSISETYKTISEKQTIKEAFSVECIKKMLGSPEDIYKFEYCTLDEKTFKVVSILPILWKDDQVEKVLLIIQNTTQEKVVELESRQMLKDAYEAANEANHAKTEFLSNMSHDIRTPMNAILGMAAIAENSVDDSERVKECLDRITQSSKHLLGLINEILDMSRIENGKSSLTEEEICLSDVLNEVVNMTEISTQIHQHDFYANIEDITHKYVYGDPLKLQQMLFNIVSNAVKYTPDGGRIRFTAKELPVRTPDTGCYQFIVEDNGIGMSEEFQKVLFEPFTRAEEHTTKIQGTGLGTAIAKSYASMMKGTIDVESKLSEGSKFTITIFLKLKDEKKTADNPTVFKEKWTDIKQCDFSGKHILLVEDNALNSEIAKTLIELTKAQVDVASDGKSALSILSEKGVEYYQLIFMDIQMPDMNGYEATRCIRKLGTKYAKKIPIVAMTANAFTEDIIKAKQSGMNDHVAKPLDLNRLLGILEKWLNI